MSKLIEIYVSNPSEENLKKLSRYIKQHSMAICFATEKEIKLLRKLNLAS